MSVYCDDDLEKINREIGRIMARIARSSVKRKTFRTLSTIKEAGLLHDLPMSSKRAKAVAQVLCSIPEQDYKTLLLIHDSVYYYLPKESEFGCVLTIHFQEITLFLSPRLEKYPLASVRYVTAHESLI